MLKLLVGRWRRMVVVGSVVSPTTQQSLMVEVMVRERG